MDHKCSALNTSVNDHKDALDPITQPLAEVVQDIFHLLSFVICVPDKDVTGKYIISAGCGGCFGDSAPTLGKMERSNLVSWNSPYMCLSSGSIFVFLASPCKTNLMFVWRQTDVMTVHRVL